MLCEWLESEMDAGRTIARFLPLYFLLRSRIPEALHAHARLVCSSVPGEIHLRLYRPKAPDVLAVFFVHNILL